MTERKPVEMFRLEKQEELYDVEEVLGRDAASVFPTMNKQLDPVEQLKAAIGAKKFVTETELEEIKAARGLTVDDGTIAADKPLAEVLAERKKAKQDAFDEQWRQMKTGKNRPLEPDELDFLDALAKHEARQMAAMQQQEAAELDAYRIAVAAAAEAKAAAAAAAGENDEALAAPAAAGPGSSAELGRRGSGGTTKVHSRPNSKTALPANKPVLKVIAKVAGGPAAAAAATAREQEGNSSKRPRLEHGTGSQQQQQHQQQWQQQQQQSTAAAGESSAGLAGLLGEYGSASEDEV